MMTRKRNALIPLAAVAAGALAVTAVGQVNVPMPVRNTVKVSSNVAGTPGHPRGVKVEVRAVAATDASFPMPRAVDAWLPAGWRYNGAKHPACTAAQLERGGPAACPEGSVMGRAPSGGLTAEGHPPPRVTVVNGGRSTVYFSVVLSSPARVRATVTGTLTRLRSTSFSYRLHAEVPEALRTVAGVPVTLERFVLEAGRGDWLATTGCPSDHRWRFRLATTDATGQKAESDVVTVCR